MSGDDREVVDLRIAESDYFLKRYAAARDGVQPYLEQASRKAEARFFYLSALRGLGEHDQAAALTRALVAEFPDSSWAGEALNNLGTHYIVTNQDDLAAQTFKELFDKFPERARMPSAPRGSTAGGPTRPATTPRPRASSRSAAATFPALRLPAAVALLVRARAREDRAARRRPKRACASSTPTT